VSTSARIFINYRRADSAGWARQLDSDLSARFGPERVFRDVAMEPGIDFVEHIEGVMDACEVCVTVIGPGWATAAAGGRRRLDDPEDLVRLEIERALQRPDVDVIPVLVDGARMPGEHELPAGLRALARRNACELTDSRWDYDVEVLCGRLRHVLGESTVEHEQARSAPPSDLQAPTASGTNVLLAVLATLAAAGCAGLVAALLSDPDGSGRGQGWVNHLTDYAIERGLIWAIVGAVVAAAVAAAFAHVRIPLGAAVVGAGAGWLGGAAGGAGVIAIKHVAHITEDHWQWSLQLVAIALPGMALAVVLARTVGARAGQFALAGLTGAALAALPMLYSPDRTLRLTVHVLLVVGAIVAILAAPQQSALRPGRAVRAGSATAGGA
jgi:hypothetical protein